MGWLGDKFHEFAVRMEAMERGAPPGTLDFDDYEMFDRAVNKRPPRTRPDTVEHHMRRVNFFRWRRLKRDFRWMQRHVGKLGMNPDDARYYL